MIEPAEILYALVDRDSGEVLRTSEGSSRIYTSENRARSIFKQLSNKRYYATSKENTKLIKYVPQEEIKID